MRDDFYDQSITHSQRMANCITRLSDLSKLFYDYTLAHPDQKELTPLVQKLLGLFGDVAETSMQLFSDTQELSLAVAGYEIGAIADVPLDSPDDRGVNPQNIPPSV